MVGVFDKLAVFKLNSTIYQNTWGWSLPSKRVTVVTYPASPWEDGQPGVHVWQCPSCGLPTLPVQLL